MSENISNQKTKEMLCKVPQITLFFWIIKVLCTTIGETASDFLNINLGFGLVGTLFVMGIVFLIVMFFQLKADRYIAGLYWGTVVLISIVGTLITDIGTDAIGIPLEFSTIFFSILLAITFLLWYLSEKTLSIHSIFSLKREIFYWLAVLFTFALGTASGDLISEKLGFGYLTTGLMVATVILIVWVLWKFFALDSILAFWLAYIMTRPLGASIGDFLSQPQQYGGLGLGATVTSAIFLCAILIVVIYLGVTKKDTIVDSNNPLLKHVEKEHSAFKQTIIACVIIAVVGVGGYTLRRVQLDNQAKQNAAAQGITTLNSENLSSFITIENDMLNMVNSGDLAGAKDRANDLESAWDTSQAELKPIDPAKWTEVDSSIDDVLSSIRTSNPDQATCANALETSLATMQ